MTPAKEVGRAIDLLRSLMNLVEGNIAANDHPTFVFSPES